MRTIHYWKVQEESYENQRKAGRYNPAREILYRDKTGNHMVAIGAGTGDAIDMFREGIDTIIMSTSYRLNYVGIEVFRDGELIHDRFLQDDWELGEVLGIGDVDDLEPITIAKRLYNRMEV